MLINISCKESLVFMDLGKFDKYNIAASLSLIAIVINSHVQIRVWLLNHW